MFITMAKNITEEEVDRVSYNTVFKSSRLEKKIEAKR
jgi:hypothetical protein